MDASFSQFKPAESQCLATGVDRRRLHRADAADAAGRGTEESEPAAGSGALGRRGQKQELVPSSEARSP